MDWRSANFFLFDGDLDTNELASVRSNFDGFLDAYQNHGLNAVSLTWFNPVDVASGRIQPTYASGVPNYLSSLPSAEVLTALTDAAQARGFKVIWKPQFITNDATAGNINPYFAGAGFDVSTFLDEVKGFWHSLAPVAQAAGTELLIVGTEHEGFAGPSHDA